MAPSSQDIHASLLSPKEIVEDVRNGRIFSLVDDEERDNKGDFVIFTGAATAEAINSMVTHARRLVCLAMTEDRPERPLLPMMSQKNRMQFSIALTVAIEAKEGVATGISAADRARTFQVAIDEDRDSRDIFMPSHVFKWSRNQGAF